MKLELEYVQPESSLWLSLLSCVASQLNKKEMAVNFRLICSKANGSIKEEVSKKGVSCTNGLDFATSSSR